MKHATRKYWEKFSKTLKIWREEDWEYVPPTPVEDLERFEREWDLPLPESYKAFLQTFGPGELARVFRFMAPYCPDKSADLVPLNRGIRKDILKGETYDSRAEEDPDRMLGLLYISNSFYTDHEFVFDTADVTDNAKHEYAVYHVPRSCSSPLFKVADCFTGFIEDFCLGDDYERLFQCPFPAGSNPDDENHEHHIRRSFSPVFMRGKRKKKK